MINKGKGGVIPMNKPMLKSTQRLTQTVSIADQQELLKEVVAMIVESRNGQTGSMHHKE